MRLGRVDVGLLGWRLGLCRAAAAAAGGQIAALLAQARPVRGLVLLYPALDVLDDDGDADGNDTTAAAADPPPAAQAARGGFLRFPFAVDWLGARAAQSSIA
eukprot:SAG11_NODE_4285_length_1968_cov_2.485821_4_plen_101_part_01